MRTDKLANFCKDFFFPALINFALKIDEISLKILLTIPCAFLDIWTFPVRLITTIPRYFYNMQNSRQNHPLYKYLLNNGVAANNLNIDHIHLEYLESEIGWNEKEIHSFAETFNFIQLPQGESHIITKESTSGSSGVKIKRDGTCLSEKIEISNA